MLHSLRRALRDKDATLRTHHLAADARSTGRQLQARTEASVVCVSGPCMRELTTGLAAWTGASVPRADPHWAPVTHGSWIGDTNVDSSLGLLVASVQFDVDEAGCASFDISFAADGRVASATLNGQHLAVPAHSRRLTTAQAGTPGLLAPRGKGL